MALSARTTVRRVGGSLTVTLPKAVLGRLTPNVGDELTINETEGGWLLTPYDGEFERAMESYVVVKSRFRNALRELAK